MEEKFNLEFTFTELNVILKACKKLPYEESAGVIQNIISQYETIQKEKEVASKPKEITPKKK
jgi:hypothetical protein